MTSGRALARLRGIRVAVDPALMPREDEDLEHFARACILYWQAGLGSEVGEALFWTFDRMCYLRDYLPQKTWRLILLIWSLDRSDKTVENLPDFLLHDLLRNFGPQIAPLVETELQRAPEFAKLLTEDWKEMIGNKDWLKEADPRLKPRDDEDLEHFARCWIVCQAGRHSEIYNSVFWTGDRMSYLTKYLPQTSWRAILLIWSLDQSTATMGMLSAGFVEDLLSDHGPTLISLVEAEAQGDPRFAKMLGGVWKYGMTDEVWARLQSVADYSGWDDIS
jgi:hypothetical protein